MAKNFKFDGLVKTAEAQKMQSEDYIKNNITIDEELKSLIPPLAKEEFEQLKENIQIEGCREPLIIWSNGDKFILIDGHNRFNICSILKIDFKVQTLPFDNKAQVKNWMIKNQLGRRNLTPEQQSYFRGKRYENEKDQGKRTDLTSGQNVRKSTAEVIATEHNVDEKTIRRDALFAKGVDRIGSINSELKQSILLGKSKVSKSMIQQIAKSDDLSDEDINDKIQKLNQKEKIQSELVSSNKEQANSTSIQAKNLEIDRIKKNIISLLNQTIKSRDKKYLAELKKQVSNLAKAI